MSLIMLSVLEMPDDLFWADDELSRSQHNAIRKEAAKEIRQLAAQNARLRRAGTGMANACYNLAQWADRLPEGQAEVLHDLRVRWDEIVKQSGPQALAEIETSAIEGAVQDAIGFNYNGDTISKSRVLAVAKRIRQSAKQSAEDHAKK